MSTLRQLSDLLRDQTKWPEDFQWDYSDSSHCAVGLACAVGLIQGKHPSGIYGADFGISAAAFETIFMTWDGRGPKAVTPTAVAKRIERMFPT
jgi:hypothetical protein